MLAWTESISDVVSKASTLDWFIVLGSIFFLLYLLGTWTHGHFRRRGLAYIQPLPFLGNMAPLTFGLKSFADFIQNLYYRYEDLPMVGVFQFHIPILLVRDPEIIKMITVKDFDHFTDHRPFATEKLDPLINKNLFSIKGQQWREMRATLSPAFTSSKMRSIFSLIDKCGEQIVVFLEKEIKKSPRKIFVTELKDFYTRFTNDVIATSAFGIQCDSLNDKNNEFYRMGKDLTNMRGWKLGVLLGFLLSPKLMEILGIPFVARKVSDFFTNAVHGTIKEREKNGIYRPDMLQLLMQARSGDLKAEAEDEHEVDKGKKIKLTDVDITAQAVIFFFAGFDTVSSLMCFMSMMLARNPDVQERLQAEIDQALEDNDGKFSYETAQKLKYLEMVMSEVLRFYAPMAFADRLCVKDYTFPARNGCPAYTIRKGEGVWIPTYSLHHDPEYWPDPERFDPERFSDENKGKINPFAYLPFGVGPRVCIGSRFALLETKVAMGHILSKYSFRVVEKTPKEMKMAKNNFAMALEGGFWLGIAPRTD